MPGFDEVWVWCGHSEGVAWAGWEGGRGEARMGMSMTYEGRRGLSTWVSVCWSACGET